MNKTEDYVLITLEELVKRARATKQDLAFVFHINVFAGKIKKLSLKYKRLSHENTNIQVLSVHLLTFSEKILFCLYLKRKQEVYIETLNLPEVSNVQVPPICLINVDRNMIFRQPSRIASNKFYNLSDIQNQVEY